MIVEFAGLPGSGKTTLSGKVKEELLLSGKIKYESITVPSAKISRQKAYLRILNKLAYALKGLFGYPLVSLRLLKLIIDSHQEYPGGVLKNYFNGEYLIGLYARYRNSNKIVLFDQGGVQALWSVFYSSTVDFEEKKKLASVFPGFLIAEHIIFLDCSDEQLRTRLEKRSGMQSRLEKETLIAELIGRIREDLELLRLEFINRIGKKGKRIVLNMDNSDETFLLDNSKIIAEKLIEEL